MCQYCMFCAFSFRGLDAYHVIRRVLNADYSVKICSFKKNQIHSSVIFIPNFPFKGERFIDNYLLELCFLITVLRILKPHTQYHSTRGCSTVLEQII